MLVHSLLAGTSLLASQLLASATPVFKRQNQTCEYDSVTDPTCWGEFSLSTNYYDEAPPDTGVTREYFFDLTNTTVAPDGVERILLGINGSFPGPTIIADWGDTVVVHLTNSLQNNGTSMHFHGIRQLNSFQDDGVASITECPIAPGTTTTYTWRATQYGTSWYHSHFALQAYNGFAGGILINGPHSAPYDEDLGILMINDWSHQTADELAEKARTTGPPTMDNALINGTNTFGDLGNHFETAMEAGKKYRIRLVNAAIDTHFKFMVDNHTLTVIATDFVPIVPYQTTSLNIGIGQRYDIVIEADQPEKDYWLRAVPQQPCSDNDNALNIKGIVRYDSASTATPETTAISYTESCDDESMDNLVPYLALEAGAPDVTDEFSATIARVDGVFLWTLEEISFLSDWSVPTIEQVAQNETDFDERQHIISLPTAEQWVYFVVQENFGVPHPIHLHGHDFWVLAQGTGTYDSSVALRTVDAPRRDVAMVAGNGYLVIGFKTDNPGIWLMHCHIGWHVSEGFALQLVERSEEAVALTDVDRIDDICNAWESYATDFSITQHDSGV